MPDEQIEEVDKTFSEYKNGSLHFYSSPILPFEVVNGIKSALISHRITEKEAFNVINDFLEMDIDYGTINHVSAFRISLEEDLSFYDASYIYLSRSLKTKLLTLDKSLAKLA